MTEKELLEDSNQKLSTRTQASKDCRAIVKKIKQITGLESESIHRLKTCWIRRGNGHGLDKVSLEKGAENPDVISQTFSKLIQLIEDHQNANLIGDLDPYFEDLKKHGISIELESKDKSYNPSVHDLIVNLSSYQKVIDDCEDEIKQMGDDAEQIQLSPKSMFPTVASLAYKKSIGKDIDDTCQSGIENAILAEKAYSTLQSINFEESE